MAIRRGARASLAILVGLALALGSPARAVAPRDGRGFGVADDTYFGFPDDPRAFEAAADDWYGRSLAALGPAAFRFQIHWNADPSLIQKAALLAGYVRGQGVKQVTVSFKKNGPAPGAGSYGASIRRIIGALAGSVDAWGPANEPNVGDSWLPGLGGARTLARYWKEFSAAVDELDPSALELSPEFADRRDLGSIGSYVDAYRRAGGGFGDVVGWHAYWGTHHATRSTTADLLAHVPAGLPVWVTEVGAFGTNTHGATDIHDGAATQNARLHWLADDPGGLAKQPRVTRIYHYHVRDTGQPDWDTALVRKNGRRRPAWYTWCVAAHGDDAGDPHCLRDYEWLLRNSNSAGPPDARLYYGHPPLDLPTVAERNASGGEPPAVYTPGSGYRPRGERAGRRWSGELAFLFGYLARKPPTQGLADAAWRPGDVLLVGDWDGDGRATPGIYRAARSEFLLRNSSACCDADVRFGYGRRGDIPLVGDWNGDGVDSVGVVRVAP